MKVGYAPRATRDLLEIAAFYRASAGSGTALVVGRRLEKVIALIGQHPLIAPRVSGKADVRVVLALPFPFKVFYRVREAEVQILHIRHTARRPWSGER